MEQRSLGAAFAGELTPVPGRQDPHCLVFDAFRLDLPDERLWRSQKVIHLHPKTFAVLCCLVARAGQLVTKDTLLEVVWPETVVSEAVLQVAIRELRRVLGDQARTPQFIETVHGRGYRFIAPVSTLRTPDEPERLETPRRVPSPLFSRPQHFVGREAELAQLTQGWILAHQGTRHVVIIAGEAGIGKTALVDTFVAQVAADENLWVGHGQCIEPYGVGEPYLPLLEALGRLGRGPDGTRLVAVLRQYAPSWLVQMPALLPPAEWEALQRTVGSAAQARMLRELTEALDALTTARPLLLVVEDLHWSDRATLEWLSYVARRPDPARLMILGTYRPVDAIVHTHPLRTVLTELRQHDQCVELALDYLSAAAVTAYLGQRFGDTRLTTALGRALHQRTNGNPLFLIAVVDELVRQQVVTEGAAGWEVRGGVDTIAAIIPVHLRALIEHQLARSSPEEQTLLEAASVAGVEFAAAAVAAGLEHAEEVVEARCTALAQQGRFLQTRGRTVWPDGTVTACYRFIHALYQEVVYQQLPAGRQSRWHARIGARLAHGFGERAGDMAAALAMHFVRGHMMLEAVPYLRQAGETAMLRSAHREAVRYFEQALSALRHFPEQCAALEQAIDLRLALCNPLWQLGELRPMFECLREAETQVQALGDHRRLGRVFSYMSRYFSVIADHQQAVDFAQRSLAISKALEDFPLEVTANLRLAQAYHILSDYRQAVDFARRNVEALSGDLLHEHILTSSLSSVVSRWILVLSLAELGDFTEGIACGQEAVRMAEPAGRLTTLLHAYHCLGFVYLLKGDGQKAIPVLERGLALCRADVPIWLEGIASVLGSAYTLSDRIAEGILLLEQAVALCTSTEAMVYRARVVAMLSEAYLMSGRIDEALPLARRALELSRDSKVRGNQAWVLRLLGEIAMHHAPPEVEQAEAHYQQALTLAETLGMRPLQAHCYFGLGTLYAKTGRREQARTALSTAIALYRAMEMTFWLPQAEAALAMVHGSNGYMKAAKYTEGFVR